MYSVLTSIWKNLKRPIGTLGTVGVLLVVLALAGLGFLGFKFALQKITRSRVRAAGPSMLAQARRQREIIVRAIEAYRESFGFYPPDNVLSRAPLTVDPANSPLLYELSGVSYDSKGDTYMPGPFRAARAPVVHRWFRRSGFINCRTNGPAPKDFLFGKQPAVQVNGAPFVYLLACSLVPEDDAYPVMGFPWNYVSTNATNNPGRFDLWVEVQILDQKHVVGNWETVR